VDGGGRARDVGAERATRAAERRARAARTTTTATTMLLLLLLPLRAPVRPAGAKGRGCAQ